MKIIVGVRTEIGRRGIERILKESSLVDNQDGTVRRHSDSRNRKRYDIIMDEPYSYVGKVIEELSNGKVVNTTRIYGTLINMGRDFKSARVFVYGD